MNNPKITVCSKICSTCAFNGSTKNTLYAEFFTIMKEGFVFPCHKYLKSKTGNESYGTETLDEIQVCRGYVAFVKKYNLVSAIHSEYPSRVKLWKELLSEIKDEELVNILSLQELKDNHNGLKNKIYLGN